MENLAATRAISLASTVLWACMSYYHRVWMMDRVLILAATTCTGIDSYKLPKRKLSKSRDYSYTILANLSNMVLEPLAPLAQDVQGPWHLELAASTCLVVVDVLRGTQL